MGYALGGALGVGLAWLAAPVVLTYVTSAAASAAAQGITAYAVSVASTTVAAEAVAGAALPAAITSIGLLG